MKGYSMLDPDEMRDMQIYREMDAEAEAQRRDLARQNTHYAEHDRYDDAID